MCWDCYGNKGGDPYKIYTQGGVEVSDFDDEIRYRHAPRKKKAPKEKRYPGCPGNDKKAHVFVWTEEYESTTKLFYRYFGFHENQKRVCAGCGHVDKKGKSEAYMARKERIWAKMPPRRYSQFRWFDWTQYDEGYMAYRREYIKKHGFTEAVWSWD